MIHRGLIVDTAGTFLTCCHHKKQLWGFEACVNHFTVHKYFHRDERPSLEELAENTICPICDGEIKITEKEEVYRLVCTLDGEHLFWP